MLKRSLQLWRFLHINIVLVRHGIDRVVLSSTPLRQLRFLSYLNPFNWFRSRQESHGESIRLALESLGPIFVKFGQVLSTRRDILPNDIADELAKLQDNVPPFPGGEALRIVEKAYRKKVSDVFQSFDVTPLASASIAQAHTATLANGREVVVKVLRPDIEKVIRRDISLMYFVARITRRFWSHGERLRPVEVVAEFERTIFDELDLMHEAANASQLRRNFIGSKILYVPEVFWDYCRRNILVTERLHGVPISNIELLQQNQVNMKQLAENGVEIFFKQVFRDSFFHADMHPGNIFVSMENKENPQYLAVDFGIMGSLSPTDQRYLAENLLAFFNRDYRQVAMLHVESGWVSSDTRVEVFEAEIRAVCEPIFEKPLKEISFGYLLLRLFQTAAKFNMTVQPQLLLLQKTLLNIEGLGRQLYPDLDLWVNAKPYLEKWVKDKIGVRAFVSNVAANAPYWAEKFVDVPDLVYKFLQQGSAPKAEIKIAKPEQPRINRALVSIGVMVAAVAALHLWFFPEPESVRQTVEYTLLGAGGFVVLLGLMLG